METDLFATNQSSRRLPLAIATLGMAALIATACGSDKSSGGGSNSGAGSQSEVGGQMNTGNGGSTSNPGAGGSSNQATGAPTGACRNVRLTTYTDNGATVGCGYHRNLPFLSSIVRNGLTFAMNEPFYGSSYNGPLGEACGECWELTTATATAIVMVADLCPINGNPPCADPNQMNFDLTEPAAAKVGSEGYDQAVARPVACPVIGNVFIEVLDRSWGYFQAAFMNYRVPMRSVEFKPVGSSTWTLLQRRWGSVWDTDDAAFYTAASGAGTNGVGATLRITSAQGQVVTSTVILNQANSAVGQTVDTGVQFDNQLQVAGDTCKL